MSQRNNIYRRPSGIYVLRLVVPLRYRDKVSQREIHISTQTTDLSSAKLIASKAHEQWLSCLNQHEMECAMKSNNVERATNLGLISIDELNESSGTPKSHILRELINRNIPIYYKANHEQGYLVHDASIVDRETEENGSPIRDSFILDDAIRKGDPYTFHEYLKVLRRADSLDTIITEGFSEETVFRVPNLKKAAAFFDIPGIRLTTRNILFQSIHFDVDKNKEEIKIALHRNSSNALEPKSCLETKEKPTLPCDCCRPDRAEKLMSWLIDTFLERKSTQWKPDQQKRMATQTRTFVELIGDIPLGALNRETVWSYESLLRKMPANRYQAARNYGTEEANALIRLTEKQNDACLSEKSVEKYLSTLSSMFDWAVVNMILTQNPAKRAINKPKTLSREQDERSKFESDDLKLIFSADWFKTGSGERNKQGRFYQFRPFYYWLPLLGLFTGARINELSQLYLKDLVFPEKGAPYIDFNLEGEDKHDFDKGHNDKSLKTVDSQRIIPIHPLLISLGIESYATALRAAGHTRLFPELKHDRIKGYGKPAGSWFNERYLGGKLNIPRDGKKTFHSFRHTFITALYDIDMPSEVRSQLAGHSRGETTTSRRYRKDLDAEKLLTYINQISFELPSIHAFNEENGIEAVKHAIRRKSK